MSTEIKQILVGIVEEEYRNTIEDINNNLEKFQTLLLKIYKQKKFRLTLWVVGEDTHWEVKKDLDLLEKAGLIFGENGYTDQSGYREYKLTDKGFKLVQKLPNQT